MNRLAVLVTIAPLLLLIACKSTETSSKPLQSVQPHPVASVAGLPESKKSFIQEAQKVEYYELPDTVIVADPEAMLTFSLPVKNSDHIRKFKDLLARDNLPLSHSPSHACKPSYNSALVFQSALQKETVLFSINCGLLYYYQERIFIDIRGRSHELERIFREIRSGR